MTPVSTLHILSYILAGFYPVRRLAECSDSLKIGVIPNDSLRYPAPSVDDGVYNLETTTTILPDYEGRTTGSQWPVEEDFVKVGPITSDPDLGGEFWNNSDDKKSNSRRDASHGSWSYANKMKILHLHNVYRSNVTPPAANMNYLEWDTELENLAQIWADNCSAQYGVHDNRVGIGQNVDQANDPTGYSAILRWFEQSRYYDVRTGKCHPNKNCGYYKQMALAENTKVGCAIARCGLHYLLNCYYSKAAEYDSQIYLAGEPCSLCLGKKVLCLKNLCMNSKQCKNNPFVCQDAACNLKCHNCGRLDEATCTCECLDGWDGRDCTQLCKNKHVRCEKKPGYTDESSCLSHDYEVSRIHCRKMCGMCQAVQNTSNNTCCGEKLCEEGYVFDPSGKTCKCVLLCPGPLCDEKEEVQKEEVHLSLAAVIGGAERSRTFPCITIWVVLLQLIEIFLHKHT